MDLGDKPVSPLLDPEEYSNVHKKLVIVPYPEPYTFSIHPPNLLLYDNFKCIPPHTSNFTKRTPPFMFSDQNVLRTSHQCREFYTMCHFYFPLFYQRNAT